ncbi:MAG: hypothetical protein KGJ86_04410 [Chloroflexota bacterium]|nr:hypothetical protein [Chloroflexota bacterium]
MPGSLDAGDYGMVEAPPLSPSIVSLFGSVKRKGRFSVPPEVHLTAAFGELKLDLREALFPEKHVLLVANSMFASLEVLLPEGVSVADNTTSLFASHKVTEEADELGPVIHLEGWSIFSDVKFVSN